MAQKNELLIKGGTTIIAAITKDSIIVAADSKHVAKYSKTKEIKETTTVCKINITNNVCYVFAGSLDIKQNGKEIFNCQKIMEGVLSNNLPFEAILQVFNSRLASELKYVNNTIGRIPVDTLEKLPFISVIITAFVNDQPSFNCVNYYLQYDSQNNLRLEIRDVTSKTIPIIHQIGWTIDIDTFLLQNPDYFKDIGNLQEKLSFLISLEAKAHPSEVGLPIDMIKMTKDGWFWVIRNKECQQ